MGYIENIEKTQVKEKILFDLSNLIKQLDDKRLQMERNLIGVIQIEFEQGMSTSIDQSTNIVQSSIVSLSNAVWQNN